MAAMAPERSRTLHNFSLPPRLNWGTQRLLRCANLNNGAVSSDPHDRKRRNASFRTPSPAIHRVSTSPNDDDDDVETIREKLMIDLRSEVDKMRAAFLASHAPPPPAPHHAPPPTEEESRPWNLRTRRAACKEPVGSEAARPGFDTASKGSPVRGGEREVAVERVKFSVALSRGEIEDDFVEMMGRRPPRKPKKRPRYVQKQLDTLFPGLWLSEITADMYKVNENPEPAK